MALRIEQSSTYKGNDRWEWSVWLGGTPTELDTVIAATWILHPTFPNPIYRTTHRADKFRLDTSGWGTFEIKAKLELNSGEVLHLSHYLVLEYPEPTASRLRSWSKLLIKGLSKLPEGKKAPAPTKPAGDSKQRPPRVFLSSSAVDQPAALALGTALEARGVELVDDTSIERGVPWHRWLLDAMQSSDVAVAIISNFVSMFVLEEIDAARRMKIPIFPVIVREEAQLPDIIRDLKALPMSSEAAIEPVADQLVERIYQSRLASG